MAGRTTNINVVYAHTKSPETKQEFALKSFCRFSPAALFRQQTQLIIQA